MPDPASPDPAALDPAFLDKPVAHRALHDAARGVIENSLSAVEAACAAGYGIEIDVQMSADAQAMVFHDPTLDRLTRHAGFVAARGAAELGTIRLRGSEDTIPTLARVLEVVAGRVPLLIELKDQGEYPGGTLGPLEAAVARDLAGYAGAVAVMSFHPGMVANLAQECPKVPRGLTGETFAKDGLSDAENAALTDYAAFASTGASFVSHSWQDLDSPAIARLKSQGVPILCWTVKSAAEAATARRIADNITFEGFTPA